MANHQVFKTFTVRNHIRGKMDVVQARLVQRIGHKIEFSEAIDVIYSGVTDEMLDTMVARYQETHGQLDNREARTA